jgi:D-3-phosphoglycerate dehydrogenase / 2-oxoglutarate reductase
VLVDYKVLVLEGITKRGAEVLGAEGWQIDIEQKPVPPAELIKMIPPYHALLLRSGSKITAEVLEAAENLKVVGRPGVGVDNVDIPAATRRGIVVMNSPMGNMVSTAELAVALLLATARNIAPADAAMKAEKWDRKSFSGTEVMGKRLGIVGLGRVGREVAKRCRAFGMELFGYDPYVAPAVVEPLHISLVSLEELAQSCDYLTLHAMLTPQTKHLISRAILAKVKSGIRIVNTARGELVDEVALADALDEGRVAGAGLDVYSKEPPVDWRLARHPKVVATPHLGATTKEAQEKVGTDIAIQVRDFLKGGIIQQAVNFFSLSGELLDEVRPAMDLAERLGSLLGQLCEGTPKRIEVGLFGELSELDAKPILSSAVAGALRASAAQNVTVVNALGLAKERGIELLESSATTPVAFANLLGIQITTDKEERSVAGTIFGGNHIRLVEMDGVEVDAIPQGNILVVRNDDTPGVVGSIGTLLGARSINIARMTVGRKAGSKEALMLIEVECEVPDRVLAEVAALAGVRVARAINLV